MFETSIRDTEKKEELSLDGASSISVIEVILPMKKYEMIIKHRVLSELGELSHFILKVMAKYSLSVEDIEDLTGLTHTQIEPVIKRLKALQFINDREGILEEKGKRIAFILENIHDKTITMFIDQNYVLHNCDWFIALDENHLTDISPKDIKVPLSKGVRRNSLEDCFRQSQRFEKLYPELLPKFIPEISEILTDNEDFWAKEWDITFKALRTENEKGVRVELDLLNNNLKDLENDRHLVLWTELLRLKVNFTNPIGEKIGTLKHSELTSLKFIYSDSAQSISNDIEFVEQPNEREQRIKSLKLECDKNIKLELLKHSLPFIDDSMQLYSRQNIFDKGWQQHAFSMFDIANNVAHDEIMRVEA
ncbi:TPA: hypothetical protein NJ338_002603 [Vibrio parahaemolyticus]|nr:hypothetical protein [Vibrio parahaemolyticus]HCG7108816.1 hypothetical protein [Vibrio parahaemolyticus]